MAGSSGEAAPEDLLSPVPTRGVDPTGDLSTIESELGSSGGRPAGIISLLHPPFQGQPLSQLTGRSVSKVESWHMGDVISVKHSLICSNLPCCRADIHKARRRRKCSGQLHAAKSPRCAFARTPCRVRRQAGQERQCQLGGSLGP